MATTAQTVISGMGSGEFKESDTDEKECLEDQEIENLEQVISAPRFTYERDFCFKVALIVAPEYTSTSTIATLIQSIIATKKKKTLISLTIRLYNEVYKNNLLKTQIKKVFDAYKNEEDNFGTQNRHRIEEHCIKLFAKFPPLQELLMFINTEFSLIFNEMDEQTFSAFIRIFLNGQFIDSVHRSALVLIRNPECISRHDIFFCNKEEEIVSASQHITFSIESIRRGLNGIFKTRQYTVLTEAVTAPGIDTHSLPKEDNPQHEVDPFFISYLKEILQDQEKPVKEAIGLPQDNDNSSLVTDQLIRIPKLIQAMKNIHDISEQQSQAPELTRNALSMLHRLDISSAAPVEDDFDTDAAIRSSFSLLDVNSEKMLLTSVKFARKQYCSFTKHEEFAALLDRFPLVEAINDSEAIRSSLLKFFRLYPGTIEIVGPHIIWIELGTALLGTITATYGILNPKSNSMLSRIWKAGTNGVVFFVFSLGASINIFIWHHPDQRNISNELFYTKIASGPIVLMALHTAWNIISPLQKEIFFPRKTCYYKLRLSLDVGTRSLYNAGVFLFAALTFFDLPKSLLAQLLPLIPGFIVSLGQVFSPFKEKLNTLMTYITFSIFTSNIIKSSLSTSPDRAFESQPHVILRAGVLSGLGIYSLALLTRNYLKFLSEYINEDSVAAEIIARKIRLRVIEGELDTANFEHQGIIVDMQEYHRLAEDMQQGRIEDAHMKTLLFSQKAKRTRYIEKQEPLLLEHHETKTSEKLNASNPGATTIPGVSTNQDVAKPQNTTKGRRCCDGGCTVS